MEQKDEQRNYFSGLAKNFGVNEGDNIDKSEVIFDLLPTHDTHPRILECGGGAGFYTRRLLLAGYRVTCLDLAGDALDVNKREAESLGLRESLETVEGDFLEQGAKLADDFDVVLFIKVLHHFSDLAAVFSALDVAFDRLRPGGQIVIFEPNGRNPLWKPFYSLQKDRVTGKTKWYYEKNLKLINKDNLSKGMKDKGSMEVRFHYVIPAMIINRLPAQRLLHRFNRMLEASALAPWASNISARVTKNGSTRIRVG